MDHNGPRLLHTLCSFHYFPLQRVMNSGETRSNTFNTWPRQTTLSQLHWLPIKQRITYKQTLPSHALKLRLAKVFNIWLIAFLLCRLTLNIMYYKERVYKVRRACVVFTFLD